MTLNADRPQREYTHKSPEFAACDPSHHWISYERPHVEPERGVIVFKCQKCGSVMQEPSALIPAAMQAIVNRRRETKERKKADKSAHAEG